MADYADIYAGFPVDLDQIIESLARTEGNGVISGFTVAQAAVPNMTVDVASGVARINGRVFRTTATTNVTIAAADPTNPRKDLVVMNASGSLVVRQGTPAAADPPAAVRRVTWTPDPLDPITANDIVIAELWVANGVTSIVNADISDRRILTTRDRYWFNAKDYGSVGDGGVDDTAALQLVLDTISASGGTLFLPAGTYKITSALTIKQKRTTILGNGRSSIIQLGSGFPASTGAIQFNGGAGVDVRECSIANLRIDCNRAVAINASIFGIKCDGGGDSAVSNSFRDLIIRDVQIVNFTGGGISLRGGISPGPTINRPMVHKVNIEADDVGFSSRSSSAGVYVSGCDHPFLHLIQVSRGNPGVLFEGANAATYRGFAAHQVHCNFCGDATNTPGYGFHIKVPTGTGLREIDLVAIHCSNCFSHGIVLEAAGTGAIEGLWLNGLSARSNGNGNAAATVGGIAFDGTGSFKWVVIKNGLTTDAGSLTQDYGLILGASTYSNVIIDNIKLEENQTGAVLDNATAAQGVSIVRSAGYGDFEDYLELSADPVQPKNNKARIYAKDRAGVTALYYKQDDNTVIELFPAGVPSGLANVNTEGTGVGIPKVTHQHKRDLRVARAGTDVGIRNRLNFTGGISLTDDAVGDEIDAAIHPNFATLVAGAAVLPAANAPTVVTIQGTNVSYQVLEFPDGATDLACYWHLSLPVGWAERDIKFTFKWTASVATGNVVWDVGVIGTIDEEVLDTAPTMQGNVTGKAAPTVIGRLDTEPITFGAASFDLVAEDLVIIKVIRKLSHANDTMAGIARLLEVTVELT